MKISEQRAELELKKMELEWALREQKPHEELIQLYRKIKELQYNVIQEEIEQSRQQDFDLV